MWVGSRSCRYQGLADIVLYGNEGDHPWNSVNALSVARLLVIPGGVALGSVIHVVTPAILGL